MKKYRKYRGDRELQRWNPAMGGVRTEGESSWRRMCPRKAAAGIGKGEKTFSDAILDVSIDGASGRVLK